MLQRFNCISFLFKPPCSELSQNRTEKQIMSSKRTVNWLFNDIWCHLFIACFYLKIGVFQQTVIKFCYVLNDTSAIIGDSIVTEIDEKHPSKNQFAIY